MIFKIKRTRYKRLSEPPGNIPRLLLPLTTENYTVTYFTKNINGEIKVWGKVNFGNGKGRMYWWSKTYWHFQEEIKT